MPEMQSPEFAATFGAMLLALFFAFLGVAFVAWTLLGGRRLWRRMQKMFVERDPSGGIRFGGDFAAEQRSEHGLWWRAQRYLFGEPADKEPAE